MVLVTDLQTKLDGLKTKLEYANKQETIAQLKTSTQDPGLWDKPDVAQSQLQQLSNLEKTVGTIDKIQSELSTLSDIVNLLNEQPDDSLALELSTQLSSLQADLGQLELTTYLSGKYDSFPAILSVHSGQGGTEAMDWASMLSRMYQRFFELRHWQYQVIDYAPGDEAGIKSIYIKVTGDSVYGYLRHEAGVHRLVRLSPFNADKLRQTSFAKVEVAPVFDASEEIAIRPEDIEFSAFRSGGHGGQNVNKVSSAVRLTHTPSSISVSCQSQRSQEQNRQVAMQMLTSKLWLIQQDSRQKEERDIKGDNIVADWGHQIRSYVLHPYKMVKDLRTRHETSDTTSVLDGHLDEFIEADMKR